MRILRRMIKMPILTIFLLISLSACSVNIAAPVELLSKPKLNSDQQFVTELIMSIIPHDAYIARPVKSNNLNSVGFIDVDGDGVNEIYAFYVDKNTKNVGLILVYHDESEWKLLTNLRLIGSDIAYSDFVDCDGDNVKEFIIGTTSEDQIHKNLYIARYYLSKFDVIYRDFYTEIIIDDFDQDSIADIAMFKLDRNNFAYAEIVDFEEEEIKITAKAELDPYISGYYNIAYDNLEKDKKAFILDFETGSKSATNILKYEKNQLVKMFDSFESDQEYKKTLKLSPIRSQDIDDDGIVEIANNFKINTNSGEPKNSSGLIIWNNFIEDEFKIKKVFFLGDRNHLKIEIPQYYIESILENKLEPVDYIVGSKNYKIDFYTDLGNMSSKLFSLNKMGQADYKEYQERRRRDLEKEDALRYTSLRDVSKEDSKTDSIAQEERDAQSTTAQDQQDAVAQDQQDAAAQEERGAQSTTAQDQQNRDEQLQTDRQKNHAEENDAFGQKQGKTEVPDFGVDFEKEFELFKKDREKMKSVVIDLAILELDIPGSRGEVFFIEFYDLEYKEVSYSAKDVLHSFVVQKFDGYHDQTLSNLLEQLDDLIQTIDFM